MRHPPRPTISAAVSIGGPLDTPRLAEEWGYLTAPAYRQGKESQGRLRFLLEPEPRLLEACAKSRVRTCNDRGRRPGDRMRKGDLRADVESVDLRGVFQLS